jgi:hypothetical protein
LAAASAIGRPARATTAANGSGWRRQGRVLLTASFKGGSADNGLGHIRDQLTAFVTSIDYSWTGYRLDFGLTAMRQSITGRIEVEDRLVRVELGLPLLHLLSKQIFEERASSRAVTEIRTCHLPQISSRTFHCVVEDGLPNR